MAGRPRLRNLSADEERVLLALGLLVQPEPPPPTPPVSTPEAGGRVRAVGYVRRVGRDDDDRHAYATVDSYIGGHGWRLVGLAYDTGDGLAGLISALAMVSMGEADVVVAADAGALSRRVVFVANPLGGHRTRPEPRPPHVPNLVDLAEDGGFATDGRADGWNSRRTRRVPRGGDPR